MKRLLTGLFLACILAFAAPPAHGQTHGIGVGASIGEPTGIHAKAWLDERRALTGATTFRVGDSRSFLLLQGNVVVHRFDIVEVESGTLAPYYGGGLTLQLSDRPGPDEDVRFDVGLRAPVGLNYMVPASPVDIFIELAPAIQATDPVLLTLEGGLGVRLFFE